jgi:hypothetical protein
LLRALLNPHASESFLRHLAAMQALSSIEQRRTSQKAKRAFKRLLVAVDRAIAAADEARQARDEITKLARASEESK